MRSTFMPRRTRGWLTRGKRGNGDDKTGGTAACAMVYISLGHSTKMCPRSATCQNTASLIDNG